MEQFLISLFENVDGWPSYAIVLGILIACGLGVPLPEDISLILGGFLTYEGKADLKWMMAVGLLGILCGDSMIFWAGWRFGLHVGAQPTGWLARVVTPEKRARVAGLFARNGEKIIMLARFLPGVRAVTYFTAGSVHMKYRRFILFDGLAAMISAPVFVYLGHYFGEDLHALILQVRKGQRGVLIGLAVVIVGYIAISQWRARRQKAADAKAAAALPNTVQPPAAGDRTPSA